MPGCSRRTRFESGRLPRSVRVHRVHLGVSIPERHERDLAVGSWDGGVSAVARQTGGGEKRRTTDGYDEPGRRTHTADDLHLPLASVVTDSMNGRTRGQHRPSLSAAHLATQPQSPFPRSFKRGSTGAGRYDNERFEPGVDALRHSRATNERLRGSERKCARSRRRKLAAGWDSNPRPACTGSVFQDRPGTAVSSYLLELRATMRASIRPPVHRARVPRERWKLFEDVA